MGKSFISFWSVLALVYSFAWHIQAAPSQNTFEVCDTLYASYPRNLVWDPLGPNASKTVLNSTLYYDTNVNYWNLRSKRNRAACVFYPSSAEEVSVAIKTLNKYPDVQFALKCSGHNPNLGFSSVNEGVLLAFDPNFKYSIPSADGTLVRVGAGAKWEDVYASLDSLGRAVVGGRLGNVGVTGFTLGGGLSHLSPQYGLACDNVVNIKCVLANGTITNANATSHPELFFALKGGGNQFAVITEFTFKTYEVGDKGQIWGGIRSYSGDKHAAILSAISNFTANNDDGKAALIPTFNFFGLLGVNIPAIIVFYFYDGPQMPEGIFDELDAIPSLYDGTRKRTIANLVQDLFAGDLEGLGFQIAFGSFPNMPISDMSSFLQDHFDEANELASKAALEDVLDFRLLTFTLQPFSRLIAQASIDAGGNALGVTPDVGDKIWVEYNVAWASPACDEDCPAFAKTAADTFQELHKSKYSGIYPTNYKSGDLEYLSYNPLFMNDAISGQDVLKSYGDATYNRLKSTHAAYDPEGLFSGRQKGFTFSQ
ncbi:unnamed protein product [Clonostachys rosea]|uniref:FAD-binding PCMH-type domain-containing protein n=1 Tax=Bionectria ochroleuca TaxID=29856 RepID=A0ABY6UN16_BIOOC|nr:unnamed protein product [Clonostachys rosea]